MMMRKEMMMTSEDIENFKSFGKRKLSNIYWAKNFGENYFP